MNIETIIANEIETNCYIVWNDSKKAIVIDPGGNTNLILSTLKKENLSFAAYEDSPLVKDENNFIIGCAVIWKIMTSKTRVKK